MLHLIKIKLTGNRCQIGPCTLSWKEIALISVRRAQHIRGIRTTRAYFIWSFKLYRYCVNKLWGGDNEYLYPEFAASSNIPWRLVNGDSRAVLLEGLRTFFLVEWHRNKVLWPLFEYWWYSKGHTNCRLCPNYYVAILRWSEIDFNFKCSMWRWVAEDSDRYIDNAVTYTLQWSMNRALETLSNLVNSFYMPLAPNL